MRVLSLGWGVQSFALAAICALEKVGEIEYAIHADTGFEKEETYEFAKSWTPWLEDNGIKVVTVRTREEDIKLGEDRVVKIPAYTTSKNGVGRLKRECTRDWKIVPIRRWIRAKTGRMSERQAREYFEKEGIEREGFVEQERKNDQVVMWLGISTDEAMRRRDSQVKYIRNEWPLIEMGLSRNDCKDWLFDNGLEIPPKSSCVICPYQGEDSWREMKMFRQRDWEVAVKVDKRIREARPPNGIFLHRSCRPLDEVDLRNQIDLGQRELWK